MAATSSSGGVPPGFRFHPTDEDLLHYYLKKKISFQKFDMEVIREVDLNKIEPWDLQERCKIGSTPQNEWYFFSHKDRKYPTGSRTNRATSAGFWKATGRDKCIRNSSKKIGMRKTLVFYRGRAPHGQKTDWIMHEYRLEDGDHHDPLSRNLINSSEDGWVICRVFKKKNLFKIGGNEGICGGSTGGSGLGGGNASMVGSSDQLSNLGNQSRTMFSHSINNHNNRSDMNSQYLLPHHHHHHHHQQQQNFVDLGLNYTHMALMPSYPHDHLQAHDFIPTTTHHKPLGVYVNPDFSSPTLPSDDAPLMVRQLMSSNPPPPCDQCDDSTGSDHQNNRPLGNFNQSSTNICNQEEPVPLEIGNNCEANSQSNMNNEWGVNMDHHQRLVHEDASTKGVVVFEEANPSSSSLHQINQLSLRGEMDFWGYEK